VIGCSGLGLTPLPCAEVRSRALAVGRRGSISSASRRGHMCVGRARVVETERTGAVCGSLPEIRLALAHRDHRRSDTSSVFVLGTSLCCKATGNCVLARPLCS